MTQDQKQDGKQDTNPPASQPIQRQGDWDADGPKTGQGGGGTSDK